MKKLKKSQDNTVKPDIIASPMACRRCGVCCKRHQAYVRPEEIQRITAFLGIRVDDWEKLYDDPRWEYDNYRLIRHVNGACVFLKWDKGLATCAIHTVKPACCTDWQPGPEKKECKEGERRAIRKANELGNIKMPVLLQGVTIKMKEVENGDKDYQADRNP